MTDALAHFQAKLSVETDASDVYTARKDGAQLTLVDVRSAEAWAQGRAVGAVHLPYAEIAARAAGEVTKDAPVVVYCWSPGCNAGDKAAVEFAKLGYDVKLLIGGFEYWAREGYPVENDQGRIRFEKDPLVGVLGH
ncbi:MAG: rhodanese-like domain-containing protein [Microbacterium sp.]